MINNYLRHAVLPSLLAKLDKFYLPLLPIADFRFHFHFYFYVSFYFYFDLQYYLYYVLKLNHFFFLFQNRNHHHHHLLLIEKYQNGENRFDILLIQTLIVEILHNLLHIQDQYYHRH